MAIHVAVVRRVRTGCEAEFQAGLREFFQESYAHGGVHGANMLAPTPGSPNPEFGILRTFDNEADRDRFYASPMFKAWMERSRHLTVGDPVFRDLTGLEAFFRTPNPPPRWKMALLTWAAVWPASVLWYAILNPLVGDRVPHYVLSGIAAAGIVVTLTWFAMPAIVRLARPWLHAIAQST